jgi:hypothetical protein
MDVLLSFLAGLLPMRGAKTVVVLALMAAGLANADIRRALGTSWDSLRRYRGALDGGDVAPLFEMPKDNRQRSGMEDYDEDLMASFEADPPKTLRDAQTRIKEIAGLDRSLTRVRKYLIKKGLSAGR